MAVSTMSFTPRRSNNRFTPDIDLSRLMYPRSAIHVAQLHMASFSDDDGALTITISLVHSATILDVAVACASATRLQAGTAASATTASVFVRCSLATDEIAAEAELVGDDAENRLEGGEAAAPEADVAFEIGPNSDRGHLVGSAKKTWC